MLNVNIKELAKSIQDTNITEIEGLNLKDIAIIGISVRLPLAENIDQFWDNLKFGIDCITELPPGRKAEADAYLKYTRRNTGSIKYKKGSYLEKLDEFDCRFFNISPREASLMDPNQRMFLEVAYSAIEDAGYGGTKLKGSRTGVYCGFVSDLAYQRFIGEVEPASIGISIPGNMAAVIPGRVSYTLDLRGPSILIDTVCSSSLVAIHTACGAIRNGDCDQAIVGTVKMSLLPLEDENMLGIESRSYACKAFDDNSDGVCMGEGVMVLVLKPLSKAVKDQDHIYAVIKGSALNQDGRSIGITAPNATAQAEVIEDAWKDAGIIPETITYIETHGTATALGDPVEIDGISRAFSKYTNKKQFCAIGSVKTNLGHLDSAAGMVGLVKAIMALKHKQIPPSLHFQKPNRNIDFNHSPVFVNAKLTPWKSDGPRRCGVSAFGLSGTNSHVILEEAPPPAQRRVPQNFPPVLTLSAKSQEALRSLCEAYLKFLEQASDMDLCALYYTANTGRGHYNCRLAIVAEDLGDLIRKLEFAVKREFVSAEENAIYYGAFKLAVSANSEGESELSDSDHKRISGDGARKMKEFKNTQDRNLLREICGLYVKGADLNWDELYDAGGYQKISLPVYPFERKRCWLEIPEVSAASAGDRANLRTMEEIIGLLEEYIGTTQDQMSVPAINVAEFERYGFLLLLKAFQGMNVFQKSGVSYTQAELRVKTRVVEKYYRLQAALLDILERGGYVKIEGDTVRGTELISSEATLKDLANLGQLRDELVKHHPDLVHYIRLLDVTVSNYQEILPGRIPASNVIFPNASTELVEKIYKDDKNGVYCNMLAAFCIKSQARLKLDQLKGGEPVRVLEIGAGTGGTTIWVLKELAEFDGAVEYYFTDISSAFVENARDTLGSQYDFVKFKKFDLEKDARKQGLARNKFDLVLGANVVHATKDVRHTLGTVKDLLKPYGIIVLIEGTTVEDFSTLTFGILDGWWLFEDPDLRLPNSPILGIDSWRKVLGENGFPNTYVFDNPKNYQTLIMAERDGGMEAPGFVLEELGWDTGFGKRKAKMVQTTVSLTGRRSLEYSELEQQIAQVWGRVLGFDELSVTDNFYELGGDSILAMKIVNEINRQMKVRVDIKALLRHLTIGGFAEYLAGRLAAGIDTAGGRKAEIYDLLKPTEPQEHYPTGYYPTGYYPASSAQRRIFFLDKFEGISASYNIPGVIKMKGKVDPGKLDQAFQTLVRRHESLRTSFELIDGKPAQRIHQEVEFKLRHSKYDGTPIRELIEQFIQPFDLSKAPLIRVELVSISEDEHLLFIDTHHIISDGTSMGVIIREIISLYEGASLPELPLQFKDFSTWQDIMMKSEVIKEQEEYWLKMFREEILVLNLPLDYPRPPVKTYEGNTITFEVGREISAELSKLATKLSVSLNMMVLAVYNTLLYKYTNQSDIVIGIPISGRHTAALENMIGMFVNTLPIRSYPEGQKTFREFVGEVKNNLLQAYDNQDYQLETLIEKLNLKRDLSRDPLFSAAMIMMNFEVPALKITGLTFEPYEFEIGMSKYDISLIVYEKADGVAIDIEYCTRLFKESTIRKYAEHLTNIMKSIVRNPDQTLAVIDFLSETEKKQILVDFNNTGADYEKDRSVIDRFEEQVAKTPDQIAVIFEDDKQPQLLKLTYEELNRKANQLAGLLRKNGVKPDSIVGIMLERSLEMIIGILGISKAGGAYLPIDPHYPEDRIRYMLDDSGAGVLLTQSRFSAVVESNCKTIELDRPEIYTGVVKNPAKTTSPTNLAYIIYTSGSTGKPKGAMIEQYSLVNRLLWMQKAYPIGAGDVILQKTPYTFDVSVWELFWWSMTGAGVCFLKPGGEKDPGAIIEAIEKNQVTVMHFVPSMLAAFLGYIENGVDLSRLKSLKYVFASGEALKLQQVTSFNRLLNHQNQTKLHNLYGPTEATVDVSYFDCSTGGDPDLVLIGKPIDNINLLVLDPEYQLQPVGVPGELVIAGDGLARGYLNRPELTAEKFVPNPFVGGTDGIPVETLHASPPAEGQSLQELPLRIYRTGDLARWVPDGNIEYLGRIDHQVKIRGFRIELGEIEAKLLKYPGVLEAVVIDREDEHGNKYLCAYYASSEAAASSEASGSGNQTGSAGFKEYLAQFLPAYMIPAYFVRLEKIPLSANGKVNRKGLPAPEMDSLSAKTYEAPGNETETLLATIWQDVLGVEQVGVRDNFFEIGGDSIKAIQVLARLQGHGLELDIEDFFQHQNIKELAKVVKSNTHVAEQGPITGEVGLTPVQQWFYANISTDRDHFNQAVMLYRKAGFDTDILWETFTKILEHHDALRMVFRMEGDQVVQINQDLEGARFTIDTFDLNQEQDYAARLEAEADKIQAGIDLSKGPLVKLALFKTKEGDHLLIVIHHLVMDGVSWRILLEDFGTLYVRRLKNEAVSFPHKTDSYQRWSQKLLDYAQSSEPLKEIAYWAELLNTQIKLLPKDRKIDEDRNRDSASVRINLTAPETESLLKRVNQAYNTGINELVLTALGLSVREWTGENRILISLEGHGRENIIPDLHLSRTIGWFTSIYPVILDLSHAADLSYQLRAVKEYLRHIPNRGVGYSILRYLVPPEKRAALQFNLKPEISFNYLGQFDQDLETEVFHVSTLSAGQPVSPRQERLFSLDINSVIIGGQLFLEFKYNQNEYFEATIVKLADNCRRYLLDIMEHCLETKEKIMTPTDLGDEDLSMEDLDTIFEILSE
ncbi:MAG TPA: amino acid adenylation domain-containing protein [Bacillota bacterium]|nr:amino acid adenylation domain-containing protein [Bacillota bacterium]